MSYSIGFSLPDDIADRLRLISEKVWAPAYDADGQVRPGVWVAQITGLLDLTSWPAGMRVIVRKERPHPGAQLRLMDVDGHRLTAFATNTARGQLADLELRHRRRARYEDRIRCAKDTGLTNLLLHGFDANQIWCEIVALAGDLVAWMQRSAAPTRPTQPRTRPDAGSRNGSGCGCCPPRAASPSAPAAPSCIWPLAGAGPAPSWPS